MENIKNTVEQLNLGIFPGFPREPKTNYFPFPKVVNGYVHLLTGSEFKVLWYILRHTWGYKKTSDTISYEQFMEGIRGTDAGTGLRKEAISKAIKGLEKKGFIEVTRRHKRPSVYKLRFKEN